MSNQSWALISTLFAPLFFGVWQHSFAGGLFCFFAFTLFFSVIGEK